MLDFTGVLMLSLSLLEEIGFVLNVECCLYIVGCLFLWKGLCFSLDGWKSHKDYVL